jgi:hypothetical protein
VEEGQYHLISSMWWLGFDIMDREGHSRTGRRKGKVRSSEGERVCMF